MDNFPPGVHVSTTVSTGATASSLATSQSNGSCRTGPGTGLRAALNSKGHINNEPGLFTYRWWGILAWSHSSSAGQRKTRISGGTDFNTTPESFQLNVFFPPSLFLIQISVSISLLFTAFFFFPPLRPQGGIRFPPVLCLFLRYLRKVTGENRASSCLGWQTSFVPWIEHLSTNLQLSGAVRRRIKARLEITLTP